MFNRQSPRSPGGRCSSFLRSVLDYCYTFAVDYWASPSDAVLPCYNSLISSSCSSSPYYVVSCLQIPPHDGHPCLNSRFRSPRHATVFHRLDLHHTRRTLDTPSIAGGLMNVGRPRGDQHTRDVCISSAKIDRFDQSLLAHGGDPSSAKDSVPRTRLNFL